ncbi:flagellar basal-body MS-ring/collar protein FliF [Paucimonas lemoignei]|uniref:flagellar basal-body MS-ring/collar protein FliF n=1 Tax=Paucimonas lemoignei TaxID=29443 RepID=UPI0014054DD0|nr:flagellar basal-body MS-ring/collar protein FliF [Paucimonas lemoignei]
MNNSKEWFLSLSRASRTGLLIGVVLIAALFIATSYWAFSTNYQVLFSDLDPQDGSIIISELDRMKVPYQLQDDGKTILVEESQVYKTRLQLMGKGVNLKGTVGFEIFNESDFGMTDFAQRINYQRALQGEIARTIMGLEEVESARVHLVVPESGILKKSDKQPKASITVTTKPGYKLALNQVVGIQRLVAAAVPDIEPSAVTILDNRGVALTRVTDKDQEEARSIESKLTIKQQTEEYFTKKIAAILDKTFGPGKAIVSVDVTLNHDSLKVTREDVLPATIANGDVDGAVSRRKSQARMMPKPKKASATQASMTAADEDSSTVESTTDEIEYMHGRKIEQLVSAPGSIKRLSVGVILPNDVDPARVEMLSKVISMSVGLNNARGDALAVYPLDQFAVKGQGTEQATVARTPEPSPETRRTASTANEAKEPKSDKYFIPVVLALLVLVVVIAGLIWKRQSASKRLTPAQREKILKEIQQWLAQSNDRAAGNA